MHRAWWCHPKRKVVTDAELVLIEYYTFCELCWLSSTCQVVWGKTKRMICNHFEDIYLWNNAFRLFTKDKSFFFFFSFWFSKVLFYADFYKPKYQYKMTWCKVLAQWVRRFHIVFSYFSYLSSFPIKMLATDVKMQKIERDPIFFMMNESFGGSV